MICKFTTLCAQWAASLGRIQGPVGSARKQKECHRGVVPSWRLRRGSPRRGTSKKELGGSLRCTIRAISASSASKPNPLNHRVPARVPHIAMRSVSNSAASRKRGKCNRLRLLHSAVRSYHDRMCRLLTVIAQNRNSRRTHVHEKINT